MPALKYQLPSSPEVYVDVVDDEDVALMIDEWREAVAGGASNLRLHIFVQVQHLSANKVAVPVLPHARELTLPSYIMCQTG